MAAKTLLLKDLKGTELRNELEERDLDANGRKRELREKLRLALEQEGKDPDTFSFEIAPAVDIGTIVEKFGKSYRILTGKITDIEESSKNFMEKVNKEMDKFEQQINDIKLQVVDFQIFKANDKLDNTNENVRQNTLCSDKGTEPTKMHFKVPEFDDMPFPRYVWHIIKNSSRAERLSCLAALLALLVCVGLIVYFTVLAKNATDDITDVAPHEWNISRQMWLAQPFRNNGTTELFDPLKLVVIQHTVSPVCARFILCAAELRNMQSWFISQSHYDIPYNFIIGNDGRVYEGRGWGIEGAHTFGYNRCSLGLGFIGDYREELPVHARVTDLQIKRAKMILEEGVKLGHLDPNYVVLGAKDLHLTASPGSNLYNAIRKWEHYGHVNQWRNSTCEKMHNLPPRPN